MNPHRGELGPGAAEGRLPGAARVASPPLRTPPRTPLARRRLAWLVAGVLALVGCISLLGIGASRPLDAHEAFVARTATEMLRRDDWVLPYFNAQVRLQKPPLNYWLTIATHLARGSAPGAAVTEFDARLPSALAALALSALTMALAFAVFADARAALLAGALIGASTGSLAWSHSAQPEMVYAAACALEVLGFALVRSARTPRAERLAALLAWAGCAIAVLAKGPLLPLMLWLGASLGLSLERRRWGAWRALHPLAGIALVLACGLPWVLAVAHRAPEAFDFWRSQMFDRTGGVGAAWWRPVEMYYVRSTLQLLAPWSLLVALALVWPWLRGSGSGRGAGRFLWWIALTPALILGFSVGRKSYYMLPALAPLAALAAGAACSLWDAWRASARGERRWLWGLRAHAAFALAAACAGGTLALRKWPASEVAPALQVFGLCAFAASAGLALTALCARRTRLAAGAIAQAAAFGALLLGVAATGLDVGARRARDGAFAREVGAHAPAGRSLLVVEGNIQVLVHYADRPARAVEREALEAALREDPTALIVDIEHDGRTTAHAGSVLVRVAGGAGESQVLLDPRAEAPR